MNHTALCKAILGAPIGVWQAQQTPMHWRVSLLLARAAFMCIVKAHML